MLLALLPKERNRYKETDSNNCPTKSLSTKSLNGILKSFSVSKNIKREPTKLAYSAVYKIKRWAK